MKYLIMDDGEIESGFVLPEHIQHKETAAALRRFGLPIRAGFIKVKDGSVLCYGESDSLELKSSPEDSQHFAHLIR